MDRYFSTQSQDSTCQLQSSGSSCADSRVEEDSEIPSWGSKVLGWTLLGPGGESGGRHMYNHIYIYTLLQHATSSHEDAEGCTPRQGSYALGVVPSLLRMRGDPTSNPLSQHHETLLCFTKDGCVQKATKPKWFGQETLGVQLNGLAGSLLLLLPWVSRHLPSPYPVKEDMFFQKLWCNYNDPACKRPKKIRRCHQVPHQWRWRFMTCASRRSHLPYLRSKFCLTDAMEEMREAAS